MTDFSYLAALLATVTFSITGVLAARATRMDLFGVVVVGVVTAVGGGTVRDIILDVPVFWIADTSYLHAAIAAAIAGFVLQDLISKRYQWLLYLDALGVALFATLAVVKTLSLGLDYAHAAVMGVITGIGGGIVRDLLTARPTLIMSRDLYATPILLGVGAQMLLLANTDLDTAVATLLGGVIVFSGRAAAIRFHLQMPDFLLLGGREQ